MNAHRIETIPVRSGEDVVKVRHAVRNWAAEMGFTLLDQTKIVTAASELARNALVHGGGGAATIAIVGSTDRRRGLRLTFEDQGPGIPDITLAMRDGFSTGDGLGHGLGGARKLSHEFEIASEVGQGTKVSITRWK